MEPTPTIVPKEDYDVEEVAKCFKKAMKGIGTDERKIIQLLVSHDNLQREEIERKYKTCFGSNLIEDLKGEIGGLFEKTAVALLTTPYDYLTDALNDSLGIAGNDPETLVEILCSRCADEIENIAYYYQDRHGESLEDALESHLSGDFKRLMVGLATAGRDEEDAFDQSTAKKEAQELYDAGLGLNSGTEEAEFIRILNSKCYSQLKEIFSHYEDYSAETIEESIKSETSGSFRQGLLAIVQRVRDPYGFYAERLNKAMMGAGTDDDTLIRILVSRSEVDLENIKKRYKEMYEDSSLAQDIKEDTSGEYRKLLLSILDPKNVNKIIKSN